MYVFFNHALCTSYGFETRPQDFSALGRENQKTMNRPLLHDMASNRLFTKLSIQIYSY